MLEKWTPSVLHPQPLQRAIISAHFVQRMRQVDQEVAVAEIADCPSRPY